MSFDETYDVVVIGSGIAGVATALAAREAGLRPVLLEKAAKLGGGTSFSMGGIWIGCNHLMLAAGYKDTRDDVLSYMRFVGAEETDDERLVAYVDRGPEALKFFEDCGIRFRISRGLTDHYFGVAPGSVAEGRCLNTDFIAATDLGEWQDSILAPRDTPIEVNSEELFNWGGIANINNWPKDVLEERRRKKIRTRGCRRHHPFRQAAFGPRRNDQARHARDQPRDRKRPRHWRRHRQGPLSEPRGA